MNPGWLLPILLLLPVLLAGGSACFRSARSLLAYAMAGTILTALVAGAASALALTGAPLRFAADWLMMDPLSAYHLIVMMLVFSLSAIDGVLFFRSDIAHGRLDAPAARRYVSLWFGALASMILVLVSNNLGIAWVGIETTTLMTAFLICLHPSRPALEAMWKYLLMCSVGVGVAFTGLLLLAAAGRGSGPPHPDALLWTRLMETAAAGGLAPSLVKAAFLFVLVGYGTKAGLAPMHNWLPDAHSQAPAPVSAIFSGFMLNAALYCILRLLPIVEIAVRGDWARQILVAIGLLSMLVAAVFIVAQHDVKRLLAYHSVEHLGIVTLGIGLGGLGTFAALFHMLNHSLCKSLSFFCAGHVGELYGTHDMRRITAIVRVSPVWGGGLAASLLALIGVAPFSLFMSELLILKAACDAGAWTVAVAFLAALAIVFVGALRHVIGMAWDPSAEDRPDAAPASLPARMLVFGMLAAVVLPGLWMPSLLKTILVMAARVLEVPS